MHPSENDLKVLSMLSGGLKNDYKTQRRTFKRIKHGFLKDMLCLHLYIQRIRCFGWEKLDAKTRWKMIGTYLNRCDANLEVQIRSLEVLV